MILKANPGEPSGLTIPHFGPRTCPGGCDGPPRPEGMAEAERHALLASGHVASEMRRGRGTGRDV